MSIPTITRMTQARRVLIRTLLAAPNADHYTYALAKSTDMTPVTVAKILRILHAQGYLTSRMERVNADNDGNPPRRLYRVDPDRLADLKALVS